MAGNVRIQVFGSKADGHNGSAQASAEDPIAPNKANCPRFWLKKGGWAGNNANLSDLSGGV